jgi:hypothetical protein
MFIKLCSILICFISTNSRIFCHFTINELDFELFEALKSRLFHDVFGKESEHYSNRWRNQQNLITKQENEIISKESSELKSALKQKEIENSE